jgi:predicted transcriptional regulator
MYRANLSFTQLNDYLTFMLINNLIIQTNESEKENYRITKIGLDFLLKYGELTKLLKY